MNTRHVTIPAQFNGPPTSGNGGYSAGALAALLDGPALVSLRSPPPLDTPLSVRETGDRLEAWHNDTLVMYALSKAPTAPVPRPPDFETAARGPQTFRKEGHPLPTCFVCGPTRLHGDGLQLFTGRVDGFDGVADVWTPVPELGDDAGRVRAEVLWAALDCPSYFAIPDDPGTALLGAICARIDERPRVDTPLIVVGWHRSSDGRKHQTGSAVFTAEGSLVAQAETLWIALKASHALCQEQVRPPAVNPCAGA